MDAGRVIPPPPDYNAMLEDVRQEVASFAIEGESATSGRSKKRISSSLLEEDGERDLSDVLDDEDDALADDEDDARL